VSTLRCIAFRSSTIASATDRVLRQLAQVVAVDVAAREATSGHERKRQRLIRLYLPKAHFHEASRSGALE
jgi:hypothetical protein